MTLNRKNSLIRPRITEKASLVSNKNVFVFEVLRDASKTSIMYDVKKSYKVTPIKIAIVNTPMKKRVSRGKVGKTHVPKKAYIYLKKGDTINFS